MVFTLHRYIFGQLFRVFLLATIALTLMMSMGAIVRPIQKYGIGPEQVVPLLAYFLPITLTFVLPMSALFAASLVYGRFASDNELDACRASGVSFTTLVYPGLFLGVAVSVTTLVLSFYVVPAFVHRAESTIKANAEQILFRNIQRKGYYAIPGVPFRIFADHANIETNTLQGVVIVESKENTVSKLIPAEAARIEFETQKNFNEVSVIAREAFQIDKHGQAYSGLTTVKSTFASLLTDDIKFQRIDDIKRIQADKMNFYPIRQLAQTCRRQLAIEMLNERIAARLALPAPENACKFVGHDRIVWFTAAGCSAADKATINLHGPIVLLELDKDLHTLICRWESQTGVIKLESDDFDATLDMILDNPTHDRGDYKGIAQTHAIKYLPLPQDIQSALAEAHVLDAIDGLGTPGSLLAAPSHLLLQLRQQVTRKIARTILEINAEVHSRLVFGLGCTLLILTGIALGVIFKGGHLLTAFGASSVPGAVLVIFIMTGKEFTKNPSISMITGIIVMWTGLGVLILLALSVYRKLLKT
ncbi:MAG: LptF/LptG family permease [Phycisphaerae bacterium]|nr:LptF/LptG family permease [Phycisphaerae bacterium]